MVRHVSIRLITITASVRRVTEDETATQVCEQAVSRSTLKKLISRSREIQSNPVGEYGHRGSHSVRINGVSVSLHVRDFFPLGQSKLFRNTARGVRVKRVPVRRALTV